MPRCRQALPVVFVLGAVAGFAIGTIRSGFGGGARACSWLGECRPQLQDCEKLIRICVQICSSE